MFAFSLRCLVVTYLIILYQMWDIMIENTESLDDIIFFQTGLFSFWQGIWIDKIDTMRNWNTIRLHFWILIFFILMAGMSSLCSQDLSFLNSQLKTRVFTWFFCFFFGGGEVGRALAPVVDFSAMKNDKKPTNKPQLCLLPLNNHFLFSIQPLNHGPHGD